MALTHLLSDSIAARSCISPLAGARALCLPPGVFAKIRGLKFEKCPFVNLPEESEGR